MVLLFVQVITRTQPIMDKFNLPGTARVSLAVYKYVTEIDICIDAIKKAKKMLS